MTTVLLAADWAVDPHAAVAAASARADEGPARFHVTVPAWLHGIDWIGDPTASVPCACAQLDRLTELLRGAGIDVVAAAIGDPDPVTAIGDALDASHADEVVLCTRGRRFLARRAQRAVGLPLRHVDVRTPTATRHCEQSA